jgi:ribonuclease BN (tRNA processing enzyme)
MLTVTVIGSGTAAPHPDHVAAGFFLRTETCRILLDCGPGVVHHLARFRLAWEQLDHLVVSHFHNDHIGDIPALLFGLKWGLAEQRTRPLTLWGPDGLEDRLRLMAGAFGDHVLDPGFPLTVRVVAPGAVLDLGGGITLRAAATVHTETSLAYRVETREGPVVGYTGDTGPSDEVARFLAGVDLLIAECSLPDERAMETHLTPSSLAVMARLAAPRRLLATHVYPILDRHDLPRRISASAAP